MNRWEKGWLTRRRKQLGEDFKAWCANNRETYQLWATFEDELWGDEEFQKLRQRAKELDIPIVRIPLPGIPYSVKPLYFAPLNRDERNPLESTFTYSTMIWRRADE